MKSDECIPTRRTLLSRLRNWDDQDSWREFFDTYWKLIFGTARRAGLSEQEAEDVVQETVISVAKTMPEFQYRPGVCSFKGWLLHLTRRRIIDQFRKRPREVLGNGSDQDPSSPEAEDPAIPQLETIWEEEWKKNLLEAALQRLKAKVNARHYQIFYLNVIKSVPSSEVADALGVSSGLVYLVRHRLTRQFKKLIRALETRPV